MTHKTNLFSLWSFENIASIKTWITALAVISLIGVVAPRTLAYMPAIIALMGFVFLRVRTGQWPVIHRKILCAVAVVTILLLMSLTWATSPEVTRIRIFKVVPIFIGFVLMISWLKALPLDRLQFFRPALRWLLVAGGLFIIIEILTSGFISSHFHEMKRFGGVSFMNTSVNVYFFCALPIFYTAKYTKLDYLVIAILTIATFLSDSQSTQLALIVFPIIYWIFPLNQRWVWFASMLILLVLFVGAPLLVQLAFGYLAYDLDALEWFASGYAAERLEIWDAIARYALEKPFWGHGIEVTRMIDLDTNNTFFRKERVLHPHNFALQIWVEFGLLGALVGCGLILLVLDKIWKTFCSQKRAGRFYLAVFAALLTVAATTYGIWQGWWLGLFSWITGAIYATVRAQNIEVETNKSLH